MKPIKVLVDVGVGRAVENWFRQNGHDRHGIRDIDPAMEDHDVLALAVKDARLVVTMDKDFGELVHKSGQSHAGVPLLRLAGASSVAKVKAVEEIFLKHGDKLERKFSVYQDGKLRIRT